jgi:RNA polymerase sigma-70 factor (ECF subfamily)
MTVAPIDPEAAAIDSLVEQTRNGDERAFTQLVRRVQPRVHRWVLSYAMSADEADDIVQEVFVLVLERLDQYRGEGSFQPWLYRVATRAAGRANRKMRRRAALRAGPRAIPDRLVYETDPGGRVDRDRLTAMIREFWQELPERQRVVVDLVDLQGHSPNEAAEMLELNQSTLRANLFKGRQTLRSRLLARFPSLAEKDS